MIQWPVVGFDWEMADAYKWTGVTVAVCRKAAQCFKCLRKGASLFTNSKATPKADARGS